MTSAPLPTQSKQSTAQRNPWGILGQRIRAARFPGRVPLAALALACTACTSQLPVHFASAPPGARILLDGQDSGFVTPTSMDLPNKKHRTVEFVLPGYETAVRDLKTGKRRDYIFFDEWQMHYNTWRFPLWLNFNDFFVERKTFKGERPSRLFVQMKRKNSAG